MPDDPVLPIQSLTPDPALDMCDISANPSVLLAFLVQHLGVDSGRVQEVSGVVVSPSQPGAGDRNKLWVKNSAPAAVGVFADGRWELIYQYPKNVALPWVGSSTPPTWLRPLSTSEKTDIGYEADAAVYVHE